MERRKMSRWLQNSRIASSMAGKFTFGSTGLYKMSSSEIVVSDDGVGGASAPRETAQMAVTHDY
jgi:hypothetical protein